MLSKVFWLIFLWIYYISGFQSAWAEAQECAFLAPSPGDGDALAQEGYLENLWTKLVETSKALMSRKHKLK